MAAARSIPENGRATKLLPRCARQIESNSRIEVLLNSRVAAVSGFIGNFQVTVEGAFGPAGRQASALQ